MTSPLFDPDKIKVEDIFRAKEARRQRIARLPFEEKIKIVEKLNTSISAAMRNEKLIFESFLKTCPSFANEPIQEWDVVDEWYAKRSLPSPLQPFDKRPDVIAVTASGRKVGIELKSWVNREQITAARKQERIQDNILKAIGKQPQNETRHLGRVWLLPKEVRFDARDAAHFREQLLSLVRDVDNNWPQKPAAERNSSQDVCDFSCLPLLEKYLRRIRFKPVTQVSGGVRIGFPSPGGFYSPNEMLETLSSSLIAHRSDERYQDLRAQVGLDEVHLLVHYDFKAFAYNTPFGAPNFGFKEAADFASNELGGDGGSFDRIFLFHFLWNEEEACRIL